MRKAIVIAAVLTLAIAFFSVRQIRPLTVTKAIRGDLVQLSNGKTVHLLGTTADDPDDKEGYYRELGIEARKFTESRLVGEEVRLKFKGNEAYLYRTRDGYDFNANAIRDGYLSHALFNSHPRSSEFAKLQIEAIKANAGLCNFQPKSPFPEE